MLSSIFFSRCRSLRLFSVISVSLWWQTFSCGFIAAILSLQLRVRPMAVHVFLNPWRSAPTRSWSESRPWGSAARTSIITRGRSASYTKMHYPFIWGTSSPAWSRRSARGWPVCALGDRVALDPSNACMECEPCSGGPPDVCARGRFTGSPGYPGGLQELVVHPARLAFPLPEQMSFVEGAFARTAGSRPARGGSREAPRCGSVAVLGCGPIGLLVLQLARLSGAQAVFVTEIMEHRRRMAESCGASLVLDPPARIPSAHPGRHPRPGRGRGLRGGGRPPNARDGGGGRQSLRAGRGHRDLLRRPDAVPADPDPQKSPHHQGLAAHGARIPPDAGPGREADGECDRLGHRSSRWIADRRALRFWMGIRGMWGRL